MRPKVERVNSPCLGGRFEIEFFMEVTRLFRAVYTKIAASVGESINVFPVANYFMFLLQVLFGSDLFFGMYVVIAFAYVVSLRE